MAILSITLPDETFAEYAKHCPDDPRRGIEAQLERFKGLPPGERVLFFDEKSRSELERLFQRPIEDPAKLVEWVKKLQELNVAGIEVPLTEGQAKRLASDAKFFNTTPEKLVKTRVTTALRDAIGV